MPSPESTSPAEELLAWYDREARSLPWRENRDPYRILVSEFMLQQTRVDTVIDRWGAFLAQFPDLESLAAASENEVVAAWSGLGYYSRARRLWRSAVRIAELGAFPRRAEDLRTLPGVGDYTAAAVASIAFGEPVPVLDGNVVRVLCRRLGESRDPARATVRRRLRDQAANYLVAERAGDSNQALMELGALVCSPRRPRCEACPLQGGCVAAATGEPERFPRARRRRKQVRQQWTLLLAERDDGSILLTRQPQEATLLAGLWTLPVFDADNAWGDDWQVGPVLGQFEHAITHRRMHVTVRAAERLDLGKVHEGPEARWVDSEELLALPRSALVDKALATISARS